MIKMNEKMVKNSKKLYKMLKNKNKQKNLQEKVAKKSKIV